MTIKAVLRTGVIEPLEDLPGNWKDGQSLRVADDEERADEGEIRAWAHEIEEAAARIPESEHQKFMEALAQQKREAKAYMQRAMASS